ncbi:guanylin-like [Astatotilapia calliptera]|uniref:Guanylate cyclase activator 2B n=2 Tax=Haplochromini TaxID=319058 RepID=A0A3Q2VSS3_HAPBU|nr:guanylin [Haplochromis burtoni]XP_023010831.1 guanylin-like [Maylandia zebra]XP_026022253.1 guanylin-like [Astatotilapia calliptera]
MRVLFALFLVGCVCGVPQGLWVRVGDKSFPLEAVKQLKKIMELDENLGSHSDAHTFKTVCANPLVPQVFRPVCQKDEEVAVFSSLMVINMNECEICANPACAGCGY